ncbi:hypothetical protein SAMN05421820_1051 [Pedobacter steynii]|uniref:Uncharacterized protein n=1 Tax=Pedobacter steynii TaxID=430522 RepID=A0A1G9VWU6_9SPHI|nr:hypothetical protein [Pedobacter steynii]NQX40121.1 hypothetical protein [Pedobacter steynii]SDM76563.1 hypothetical protein SAMN05421820_1051 [Pedobacter steynii]
MKEYTFKYQNNKGGLYFLSGLLGIPFVVLFSSLFLLDYVSWILWISIPLGIALTVYCVRQFIKKSGGKDTITVDDEGFTSKDYGRVLYSDIHSIPPYGAFQAPPPSMRIRLHNGGKLVWKLSAEAPKSAADVATFTAFREELLEHLKQQRPTTARKTNRTEVIENKGLHEQEKTSASPAEVVEQLERHKKRDFNYKYVAIPFGLALAVVMFVRSCGEDMIREHRQKEFEGVRNTILSMETNYEDNLQKAMSIAKTYARQFGPVFLFTNDPQAKIEFIPDIRGDASAPDIKVMGLRRLEDNEQLRKFVEHPDRVGYDMFVVNPSMKFSAIMGKSLFGEKDSPATVVYFAVYNPNKSLPSSLRSSSDTTFHPVQYISSINIPKVGKLTEAVLKNMDFVAARAILQKYKGTYFYIAVKGQKGIPSERFEELKKLIAANFEEQGIKVDGFQSKRFNE